MKSKKLLLFALILSGILVLSACAPTTQASDNTIMDAPAPDDMETTEALEADDMTEETTTKAESNTLLLYTLDGEEVNVLTGDRVYIKSWASWCSICLSGLQELDDLAASDTDFKVISVVAPSVMGEINETDFIAWWAGLEYKNIEVLIDRGGKFFAKAGVRAFPTSVYLNSAGDFEKTIIGHNSNELIKETMDKIS